LPGLVWLKECEEIIKELKSGVHLIVIWYRLIAVVVGD
jgi:hypothetical protein